ncbi:hypothetical protein FDP22_06485 [Paroceanicella profunda]|uniref:Mitochondrial inner membrane protein n=1 Tax=Paroceanicella profunda TaxID=2579971 RepID=A0A5B8FY70_9RHOB|nr:mitofilin family membrane protein [Paroceanicella profunda]QDL91462.1 hypothetical protein FDP22_06485 [Paroceanicella profunda]
MTRDTRTEAEIDAAKPGPDHAAGPKLTTPDPFADMPSGPRMAAPAGPAAGPHAPGAGAPAPDPATAAPLPGAMPEADPIPDAAYAGQPEAPLAPAPLPEEHEHEEEEHYSIAGRVLTGLVLILIGGALFLWAGPKLAPHLPSGMAPVAAWLTPGGETLEAEIAQLRAELDSRIDALDTGPDEAALTDMVNTRVAQALQDNATDRQQRLDSQLARIDQLSDQIAASDSGAIETRLAQAESQLKGLEAQISSLGDGLAQENAARLDSLNAAVDGVKAELADLTGRVGGLSQKVDEVAATSARRAEESEAVAAQAETVRQSAEYQAALNDIGAAIETGAPLTGPIAALSQIGDTQVPEGLTSAAQTGVPTLAALRADFPDAAHAAIRASLKAGAGTGIFDRATAFLSAQVASRSLTEQEGDSTDAILSRVDARLREDKLDAALTEAEALPPEAKEAMAGWLERAARRRDALAAYETLREAPVAN